MVRVIQLKASTSSRSTTQPSQLPIASPSCPASSSSMSSFSLSLPGHSCQLHWTDMIIKLPSLVLETINYGYTLLTKLFTDNPLFVYTVTSHVTCRYHHHHHCPIHCYAHHYHHYHQHYLTSYNQSNNSGKILNQNRAVAIQVNPSNGRLSPSSSSNSSSPSVKLNLPDLVPVEEIGNQQVVIDVGITLREISDKFDRMRKISK